MRINQSFCYGSFTDNNKISTKDLFAAAREIGYPATEFWYREAVKGNYETMIEEAHSAGLVVASMIGHHQIEDGLNKPDNHDRIEQELHESITIAAKFNIPGLIVFAGNRFSKEQSDLEGMVCCKDGLKRIAPYAEEKKINLNVELLSSRYNHDLYLCDKTDWGVALCEMVDSPRVKLLYDIYHMQIMEGDIINNIRRNIKHIGHFHTAGHPERKDLDDLQEINYRGVCKAIADTGYNLYLGHEYHPKGDPIESLRSAFEVCDQ